MADISLVAALAPLTTSPTTKYHLSLETEYGLILEVSSPGFVSVRLAESPPDAVASVDRKEATEKQQQPRAIPESKKGYDYYIWPDYKTSFVWYTPGWVGNPVDESNVEEFELQGRYSAAWCSALDAWVERYTAAFEAQECQLGSGEEPFADVAQRNAWLVEGMLLSCWLALQPGVESVSYDAVPDTNYPLSNGQDMGATILRFLGDLRAEQGSST